MFDTDLNMLLHMQTNRYAWYTFTFRVSGSLVWIVGEPLVLLIMSSDSLSVLHYIVLAYP
jgi:hypothetical protein